MNYEKLIANNPFSYGKMVNSLGQTIVFYEHPVYGESAPIICACHDLKLAARSTFYETNDMTAEHGEYEPTFVDGKLLIGGFDDN